MMDSHHLTLRFLQLPPGAEWSIRDEGLLFVFPQAGRGHCACGSMTHTVDGGDVVVVNGTAGAVLSVAKGAEFSFAWFALRMEHLFPLFGSAEISVLQDLGEVFKAPRCYPNGTDLTVQCRKWLEEVPSECNLIHRGSLLRVAGALLMAEVERACVSRMNDGDSAADNHFFTVFARLSVDEFMAMEVDQIAAKFGCGRRHLNRLFQRNLGHSVAGLRMELRMVKAAALLRSPNAKVITVAGDCGFHHLGLFNSCFKKRFGLSPGQWRKSLVSATTGTLSRDEAALEAVPGGGALEAMGPLEAGEGLPAATRLGGLGVSKILEWQDAGRVDLGGEGNGRRRMAREARR